MRKLQLIVYTIFWAIALCVEILPWVPTWQPGYWLMAICNFSLYGLLFFCIHKQARALAASLPITSRMKDVYRSIHFWALILLPFIYAALAWLDDMFIIDSMATKNIALYILYRLKTALPYIVLPALWSGFVVYKDAVIQGLKVRKVLQEQENAFLKQRYKKLSTDLHREVKEALNRFD